MSGSRGASRGVFRGLHRALRQLRIDRGLTQGELAEAAGIGKASLETYESGRSEPRLGTLGSLLAVLDADLAELGRFLEKAREPSHRRPRTRSRLGKSRRPPEAETSAFRDPDVSLRSLHRFLESIARMTHDPGETR